MGLGSYMREGRRVILSGRDPAVAKEWRDVAKKYQSVLPASDDEDPAF
jgi:hypothetical protein